MLWERINPPREQYMSWAMERWHIVEDVVKEIYGGIEEVGFIQKNDLVGISPDGIVRNEEWKIVKAIEVKAPEMKTWVRYWLEDGIPSEYLWQVVHYFVVIDTLESLDFIVANPDIPDKFYRFKIQNVTREELQECIDIAKQDIELFSEIYTEKLNNLLDKKPKL